MAVKSWWIPKSERGREVVHLLKESGFDATYNKVLGRYVCNLFCWPDIDGDVGLLRKLAFCIDPERAYAADEKALEQAAHMTEAGGFDYGSEEHMRELRYFEQRWVLGIN